MNLEKNPTKDELKELLRPCNDEKFAHIIYVTKIGIVKIQELVNEGPVDWAEENENYIQFRLETCVADNGYTGEAAANDEKWIDVLYTALTKNWEEKNVGYIDNF